MLSEAQKRPLRDALARAGAAGVLAGEGARRIAGELGLPLREVECFALEADLVPERYQRNIPSLGRDGQLALLRSCAVVVGLGGLGGHVVEHLARLGVGRLVGIDGDRFTESNLNRQLLSTSDTLGQPKADVARERVARVNPAVEFVAHAAAFESIADGVFVDCDVVLDCLDTIPARRALAGRCAAAGRPLVHGAIAGWCGQVAVCPPGGDVMAKLYAEDAVCGLEAEQGNLPFTAAFCAALMSARAAALLAGTPPRPTIVFFDLQMGDWQVVEM